MKLTIWDAVARAASAGLKASDVRRADALELDAGGPTRFVMTCACAVHDKGFTALFVRGAPGSRFVVTDIVKDNGSPAGGRADAPRLQTLPAAEVDVSGWRCPYCESRQTITCTACRTQVCGGRSRIAGGWGDIFQCRASCGARGVLVAARSLSGSASAPRSIGKGSSATPSIAAPAAPQIAGGKQPPRLK